MFVDEFTAQFDYLIVLRSPYEFIDEENLEQIINSNFKCGCLVSLLLFYWNSKYQICKNRRKVAGMLISGVWMLRRCDFDFLRGFCWFAIDRDSMLVDRWFSWFRRFYEVSSKPGHQMKRFSLLEGDQHLYSLGIRIASMVVLQFGMYRFGTERCFYSSGMSRFGSW